MVSQISLFCALQLTIGKNHQTRRSADIARGASAELSPSVAKLQDPRQAMAVLVTRAVLGYGL